MILYTAEQIEICRKFLDATPFEDEDLRGAKEMASRICEGRDYFEEKIQEKVQVLEERGITLGDLTPEETQWMNEKKAEWRSKLSDFILLLKGLTLTIELMDAEEHGELQ